MTSAIEIGVPGPSSLAAGASIAAATAAGVFVVRRRVAIGSPTACIAGRSASSAAIGVTFDSRVDDCIEYRVKDVARRAGDTFTLSTMKSTRGYVAIVSIGAACSTVELPRSTASEAHPVEVNGGPSESQVAGDVKHQDATGGAIPA
jgi:hypothetical protein